MPLSQYVDEDQLNANVVQWYNTNAYLTLHSAVLVTNHLSFLGFRSRYTFHVRLPIDTYSCTCKLGL